MNTARNLASSSGSAAALEWGLNEIRASESGRLASARFGGEPATPDGDESFRNESERGGMVVFPCG